MQVSRRFFTGILFWLLLFGVGQRTYAQQPEEAIGIITALEGEVLLFRPGETTGEEAQLKDDIFLQDTIVTGARSKVKIVFVDDSILSLGENTRMEITKFVYNPEENFRQSIFTLGIGKLRALIGRLFGANSRVQVRTPTAIAGVRGTYFIVHVISEEITEIVVLEGEVTVTNILEAVAGEVTLRANESTRIQLDLPPTPPVLVPPPTLNRLKRETRIIEEPPPETPPQGIEAPGGDIKAAGLPLQPAEVPQWEQADEAEKQASAQAKAEEEVTPVTEQEGGEKSAEVTPTTPEQPPSAPLPALPPPLEVIQNIETAVETGLVVPTDPAVTPPSAQTDVQIPTAGEQAAKGHVSVRIRFPGR